jgi:hypothetical protein
METLTPDYRLLLPFLLWGSPFPSRILAGVFARDCEAYRLRPREYVWTAKVERRLKLIGLSNRCGFAIIEDDYDRENHFEAKSLLSLASEAQAVKVIYKANWWRRLYR